MWYWWTQSLYVGSWAYWLFNRTYKEVANEWILYFHSKILYLLCTGILTAFWSDWSSIDRSTGVWIGLEPYWWWRFFQLWHVTPFMDLMVEAITVALCDAQYPAGQQQLEVLPNMPTARQYVEEFLEFIGPQKIEKVIKHNLDSKNTVITQISFSSDIAL